MSLTRTVATAVLTVLIFSTPTPTEAIGSQHRGEHTLQLEHLNKQYQMNKQYQSNPNEAELCWEIAKKYFEVGDLDRAEQSLNRLLQDPIYTVDATSLLASIFYLQGKYELAEKTYLKLLDQNPGHMKSEIGLLYVYYQTNQYTKAQLLFRNAASSLELPDAEKALWTLMCSFGEEAPYVTWKSEKAIIPFTAMDFLPVVTLRVNGRPVNLMIDTGADLLLLDAKIADLLGLKPVATTTGVYAGGKTAQIRFARLDSLDLGNVVLHSLPVEVAEIPGWTFQDEKTGEPVSVDGILSTAVFHQFLTTIDYQERKLIMRPRNVTARIAFDEECAKGGQVTEIPFIMDAGHFMIVKGDVNGKHGMTFFLDSGLNEQEAAILLQKEALDYAGVNLKDGKTWFVDENAQGGLGGGGFKVTSFTLNSVVLGGLRHTDVPGLYGVLPPELYHTQSGMILDGFISHQFLRHYKWTIDFDRMIMTFQH